jgi:hypothetical protein
MRPFLIFVVIVLGPFCISRSAIAAPQRSSDDRSLIGRCLDAARADAAFGGNCVGIIADPCIKNVRNSDSFVQDARNCAARELAVWEFRLQEGVRKLNRTGSPTIKTAVASAQSNWAAARGRICPAFNNLDPGAVPGSGEYCRLQETARIALLIEWLLAATVEH